MLKKKIYLMTQKKFIHYISLIQEKNIKSLSNEQKKNCKHTILIKYNFKKDNFIQKKTNIIYLRNIFYHISIL